MDKKIGIILVNYKEYARRFLAECRDSLRAQNYQKELIRVYIVDNASSDESFNYLKKNYPEAKVIARPDGNYAAANNAGIKAAIEDGCEYFVIANMDTKFDPDWLVELAKAIESDPEIGIAQSKILLYPQTEEEWKNPKINTLGNLIHFMGYGGNSFYGHPDSEHKIEGCLEISYASGCALIMKKEVFEKIGGYNEEYFMYHDDVEISWKTRLAGYKIVLAPKSVVYHKYEFNRSIKMIYYMERNRYFVVFSYYHILTLILLLPMLAVIELGMLIFSIKNGWFEARKNLYLYFLKISNWQKILKFRREAKKIRKISEKEAVASFAGKLMSAKIHDSIFERIVNPCMDIYWKIIKKLIIW